MAVLGQHLGKHQRVPRIINSCDINSFNWEGSPVRFWTLAVTQVLIGLLDVSGSLHKVGSKLAFNHIVLEVVQLVVLKSIYFFLRGSIRSRYYKGAAAPILCTLFGFSVDMQLNSHGGVRLQNSLIELNYGCLNTNRFHELLSVVWPNILTGVVVLLLTRGRHWNLWLSVVKVGLSRLLERSLPMRFIASNFRFGCLWAVSDWATFKCATSDIKLNWVLWSKFNKVRWFF